MSGVWDPGRVKSEVPDLGESVDKSPEAGGSSGRSSVCLESNVKRNEAGEVGRSQICRLFVGQIEGFSFFMRNRHNRKLKPGKG